MQLEGVLGGDRRAVTEGAQEGIAVLKGGVQAPSAVFLCNADANLHPRGSCIRAAHQLLNMVIAGGWHFMKGRVQTFQLGGNSGGT